MAAAPAIAGQSSPPGSARRPASLERQDRDSRVHAWRTKTRAVTLVFAALFAVAACAVTQEVTVRADRSGETAIAIDLAPALVARVQELAAFAGDEPPEDGAINLAKLRHTLSALPGMTVIRVESPGENRVEVEYSFKDAPAAVPSPSLFPEPSIVTFEDLEEGTRLRLYLDLHNYDQLRQIFPALDDGILGFFGPGENTEITAEDYLMMMGFILGPRVTDALSESVITIRLTVDGELISQRGGRLEDGVAVFEINLLDLLLLHEPVDLEIVLR